MTQRNPSQRKASAPWASSVSLVCCVLPWAASAAPAAPGIDVSKLPPVATGQVDFSTVIRPIFEKSCFRCHGPERPKSGFSLADREDALKGGAEGTDIIPGDSARSPLIHYVSGLVEDMQMPPQGKAEPLTAGEIGQLRAWIDQGAAWGEAPTGSSTWTPSGTDQGGSALTALPTFGGTTVDGDEARFREHWWRPDGWNGGASRIEFTNHWSKVSKLTLEGRALLNDYHVSLRLDRKDLGFASFGWEQYRKYFDDSGGYYPAFDPSVFSLDRDLHLDMGRAWAQFGLALPSWPRLVLGYEYQYRDGEKSTLEWGSATDGLETRNIYPGSKTIHERVHILTFDLDHEIEGYRIEDNFRGEFYDVKTERLNTRSFTVGNPGPSMLDDIREGNNYFEGANALALS
jgi:mono/diheme cytochrome c family protein